MCKHYLTFPINVHLLFPSNIEHNVKEGVLKVHYTAIVQKRFVYSNMEDRVVTSEYTILKLPLVFFFMIQYARELYE